ncbi:hypothetical protein NDU88_002955 [Pleurodeles waltl]|uniref:Uncharacterized protein n=1 Tax=Pleurodeles waltl TaxID=8319 RepID=A0AAV7NJ98_PLEWA|nr:hypothetical protein NDU88_002955 [Pleurodeles waltl]
MGRGQRVRPATSGSASDSVRENQRMSRSSTNRAHDNCRGAEVPYRESNRPIQPSSRQGHIKTALGAWIAPSSSCRYALTSVRLPTASPLPVCVGFQFYYGLGQELLVYATAILGG